MPRTWNQQRSASNQMCYYQVLLRSSSLAEHRPTNRHLSRIVERIRVTKPRSEFEHQTNSVVISLALFGRAVERLGEAFERIAIGRLRPARGGTTDDDVLALAHGLDHACLLGGVADPGAVGLGVHDEFVVADFDIELGVRLELIADDHRDLVVHVLGRTRGDEQIGRVARLVWGRGACARRRSERVAYL